MCNAPLYAAGASSSTDADCNHWTKGAAYRRTRCVAESASPPGSGAAAHATSSSVLSSAASQKARSRGAAWVRVRVRARVRARVRVRVRVSSRQWPRASQR